MQKRRWLEDKDDEFSEQDLLGFTCYEVMSAGILVEQADKIIFMLEEKFRPPETDPVFAALKTAMKHLDELEARLNERLDAMEENEDEKNN